MKDYPGFGFLRNLMWFLVMGLLLISVSACGKAPTAEAPELVPTITAPTAGVIPTVPPAPVVPTPVIEQTAQWQSNWLHFGVDNQFSSYKPDETRITKQNIAGLQRISGSGCDNATFAVMGGTPSIYKGQMIITYAGGNLEVGNPYTNKMEWDFGKLAYGWAPPPVVSTDGVIYYLYVTEDASSRLFAVNSDTRQQIWEAATQFKTGFNFDAQVTVDEKNGLVYVIEDLFGNGRLYAVDRASGEIKWYLGEKQQEKGVTFTGSFIPVKDDRLYVPARVPEERGKRLRMVRVDPLAQQIDMQYEVPEELSLSWGVGWYGLCKEHVFETYQDSSREATILVAHSVDQPGITWQTTIPAQSGRFACDPLKGILYVPTKQSLLALEAETGALIWEHKSLNSVFTPTIANGIIYYNSETNMYALNQEDGSQIFRYPLGVNADPSTGVAVNDGLVIFSGSGGTCDLYVLGLK